MFGAQNKPLFGATSTAGAFGSATNTAAVAPFGATATNTFGTTAGGGLFSNKPVAAPAFGASATTSAGGFGGFGAQTSTGLFGQQQQQKPLFAATTSQVRQAINDFFSTQTKNLNRKLKK